MSGIADLSALNCVGSGKADVSLGKPTKGAVSLAFD
jgi:hypothetical protein